MAANHTVYNCCKVLSYPKSVSGKGQFSLMDQESILFLASVGLLMLYLIVSTMTEMGTKLPWKK